MKPLLEYLEFKRLEGYSVINLDGEIEVFLWNSPEYGTSNFHSKAPSGAHTFTIVCKACRALLARSGEGRTKIGLCDSDFRVLVALLQNGPQPVNVVGVQIGLTTGSISTAINRLASKRLVVRKLDPGDGRVRVVELTPKGRRVIERGSAEHAKNMDRAFRHLSQDQRVQLIGLLELVIEASSTHLRVGARAI